MYKRPIQSVMENRLTLFSLPQSIRCMIFSKWLPFDSVGVIDIAIAEIHSRRVLLENLFVSLEFEFKNNNMCNDLKVNKRRDGHGFVLWLYNRRKSIKEIKLRAGLDEYKRWRVRNVIWELYVCAVLGSCWLLWSHRLRYQSSVWRLPGICCRAWILLGANKSQT